MGGGGRDGWGRRGGLGWTVRSARLLLPLPGDLRSETGGDGGRSHVNDAEDRVDADN